MSFLLLLPLCSFTQVNNTLKKYICEKLSACLTQAHSKNCLFSMGLLILNLVDCFRGIQNQVGTEFTLGPDRTFSWLHFNLITFQRDAWKAPAATTGHKDSTARLMASWGTQNTLKIQPRKKQHVVPRGALPPATKRRMPRAANLKHPVQGFIMCSKTTVPLFKA